MSKGLAGWIFGALAFAAALFYLTIASDSQRIHREHLVTCTNKVASLEMKLKAHEEMHVKMYDAAKSGELTNKIRFEEAAREAQILLEWREKADQEIRRLAKSAMDLQITNVELEDRTRLLTNVIEGLKMEREQRIKDKAQVVVERDHYKDLLYQIMVPADLKKELGIFNLNTNTPNAINNEPK
jgi:hypothetical protein